MNDDRKNCQRVRYDIIGWMDGSVSMEIFLNATDEITIDVFYTDHRDDVQSHQMVGVPVEAWQDIIKTMINRGWITL